MKRKLTFKSLFLSAAVCSFLAFAFVNIKAQSAPAQSFTKIELAQSQVEAEDAAESREIKVPNVSVLGRLWDIAQRLMDRAN